jgi:hypothetical protein
MNAQSWPRPVQWRLIAAMLALAGIWLAMLLGGTGPIDRTIYEALYAGHRPVLLTIARIFTAFGEPTPIIAAPAFGMLWLWRVGRGRVGLTLLVVTLNRPRFERSPEILDRASPAGHRTAPRRRQTSSFPSGHATSSMIFYLTVALLLAGHSRGASRRPLRQSSSRF